VRPLLIHSWTHLPPRPPDIDSPATGSSGRTPLATIAVADGAPSATPCRGVVWLWGSGPTPTPVGDGVSDYF
ncbi:MAG: hypothetical protein LBV06_09135, partial [Propionibacteriaceae bacterium]|nr:hypothetical protein [Propionibacteriaceae bacterium]